MSRDAEHDSLIGFFDEHGGWATVSGLREEFGDELDTSVREALENLEDIDIVRVVRNDAGQIVTSQLTQFAVDLYEAKDDDEAIAAYIKHGKEPPEDLREEYVKRLREKKR